MKMCWKNVNQFGIRSATSCKKDKIKTLIIKKIFLNTKITSFNGNITTGFYNNKRKEKTPKIDCHYTSLPEIVPNSVYRVKNDDDDNDDDDDDDDKHYPYIFLEQ